MLRNLSRTVNIQHPRQIKSPDSARCEADIRWNEASLQEPVLIHVWRDVLLYPIDAVITQQPAKLAEDLFRVGIGKILLDDICPEIRQLDLQSFLIARRTTTQDKQT